MSPAPARPNTPTDARIAEARASFEDFLRERGDRVTQTRRRVFEEALRRRDHFRADDLASALSRGRRRVSRGTVYRTLALMEEGGFVRTLRDGGMHRHYESTAGDERHDHMICRRCGRFIEFAAPTVADGIATACRDKGFRSDEHRLVIFGICRRCLERRRNGEGTS